MPQCPPTRHARAAVLPPSCPTPPTHPPHPHCTLPCTPSCITETKLQRMSLMQEGRAMGEGQEYNASSYKRMADEFRTNWMDSHYQDSSMAKGSRRALEIDYWRLIKGASGEDVQVEYGNDLSTADYGSGFPLRHKVRAQSTTRLRRAGTQAHTPQGICPILRTVHAPMPTHHPQHPSPPSTSTCRRTRLQAKAPPRSARRSTTARMAGTSTISPRGRGHRSAICTYPIRLPPHLCHS